MCVWLCVYTFVGRYSGRGAAIPGKMSCYFPETWKEEEKKGGKFTTIDFR